MVMGQFFGWVMGRCTFTHDPPAYETEPLPCHIATDVFDPVYLWKQHKQSYPILSDCTRRLLGNLVGHRSCIMGHPWLTDPHKKWPMSRGSVFVWVSGSWTHCLLWHAGVISVETQSGGRARCYVASAAACRRDQRGDSVGRPCSLLCSLRCCVQVW